MNCLDPMTPKFAGITKVRISFLNLRALCHLNVYMDFLDKM